MIRRPPRSTLFPYTRSSDLQAHSPALTGVVMPEGHDADHFRKVVLENFDMSLGTGLNKVKGDRKSTRLNSSHGYISYAVFCLKKKNKCTYADKTASQTKFKT